MAFYKGYSLLKHMDSDLEKGDVGFVSYMNAIETVAAIRFMLSEVIMWRSTQDPLGFYKEKREMVTVELKNDSVTIIDSIENFDYIMTEYHRPQPFKLN